jgi:hypothetical protein
LPQPLNTQLSTINSSHDLQRHASDEEIPVREETAAQITAEKVQAVVERAKHAHQRSGHFHRELQMLRRVEDQRRVKDGEAERRKNLNEKQNRCSLRSRREALFEEFHVFEFKEAARRDSDNPASGARFRPASARERNRRLRKFIRPPFGLRP